MHAIAHRLVGPIARRDGVRAAAPAPNDTEATLSHIGNSLRARADRPLGHPAGDRSQPSSPFSDVANVWTSVLVAALGADGAGSERYAKNRAQQTLDEIAAGGEIPLDEMTRRCLRWREETIGHLKAAAADQRARPEVLEQALAAAQQGFDSMLLQVCASFERERIRTHDELRFLATHDSLTGLPNRALITERLGRAIDRASRPGVPTLVFIDLDDFKVVNDALGHSAGDELLCAVTARLRDVVDAHDVVGRLGGDEFVVIVEEMPQGMTPRRIAERIVEAFREPFALAGGQASLTVTASVGVASSPRRSAEALLRDADVAMYRAKGDGKNRCVQLGRSDAPAAGGTSGCCGPRAAAAPTERQTQTWRG